MKVGATIMLALIGLLIYDWQANNSRYSNAFVRMATEIKRSFVGR
jgi:hypothetical protein